jgi:hypothetical protein
LRASRPPHVLLSVVFARLGACLFRASHATGLLAIEVVFPAVDVPLRTLELPDLHGDRVTAEAPVVSPCLVVASALGSAFASVSTASPGTLAAGRAEEFCYSVSRKPAPPVVLTRPRACRARSPPPDPSTLRRSGRIVAKATRGHPLHHPRAERRDAPAWSDWHRGGARRHCLSGVLAPVCYRSLGEPLSRDPSVVQGCLGRCHLGLYPRGRGDDDDAGVVRR